ncbi:MAG: response regulator [Chitinophagaceae bacterium]
MKNKLNCVLVIDDDEPTNFFTHMILEESGCTRHIKIAQSGQEALDYLIKSEAGNNADVYPSPDLIFLDINMPAMDGWEFLEEYKKLNVDSRIIVVMLTTSLFPEDKLRAERMPEISGFENKPLTAEKVALVLEKYFANVTAE